MSSRSPRQMVARWKGQPGTRRGESEMMEEKGVERIGWRHLGPRSFFFVSRLKSGFYVKNGWRGRRGGCKGRKVDENQQKWIKELWYKIIKEMKCFFFVKKNNHQTIKAKEVNTVKAVEMSAGLWCFAMFLLTMIKVFFDGACRHGLGKLGGWRPSFLHGPTLSATPTMQLAHHTMLACVVVWHYNVRNLYDSCSL